ncbi:MAG: hypothetical protein ACI35Q_03025 [Marinilabiliaceae bacterium]
MEKEKEPWGAPSHDGTTSRSDAPQWSDASQQADESFGVQIYDDEDISLRSAQSEIARGNELSNETIRQLEEEDQRLKAELDSLRGEVEQLCAQYNELPAPKSIMKIAQEVAKDYLTVKNLTAQQAGSMVLKAITKRALRANVTVMLADVGGRLVKKLMERGNLNRQCEALSHQSIEAGNKMLTIGSRRIDIAKERYAQMGVEFARRHEQRQQDYDDMVRNSKEESRRQWDAINKPIDEVESDRKDEIDDLINGFDNI